MADLDDFFAKKDRKKYKGTKKFTTTEEVAKKLEDSAKKPEKPQKKERAPEGEEGATQAHEQDEWKEFEEEKKDYSGLKIGNLTISSSGEGNSNTQDSTQDQQQGYDSGNDSDRKVGPWKRVETEEQQQQPAPPPPPPKQPEPQPAKTNEQPAAAAGAPRSGAYVPPSMRGQPQQQSQQPLPPSRLRSKVAPDIHNEENFPTLAGTKQDRRTRNEGSFELVSHNRSTSHRHAEQTKATSGSAPKLSLGNRYNTLSNDS